jgi:SlyX protein
MEPRVEDLEIRYAHQEAALEELSQTVARQGEAIARLRAELDYLKALLLDMAPDAVAPLSEETRPPHY